jgi:hypothetical protein
VTVRVTVTHDSEDSGYGGRVEADVRRRMGARHVVGGSRGSRPDALVAVIGPGWLAHGPPAQAESLLAAGVPAVPVLVGGAALPAADALPEHLRPLARVEPVHASDEYWEATITRIVERLREAHPRPSSRLIELIRNRPRISIAAIVSTIGGTVALLATLGVIGPNEPLRGTVEVGKRIAAGVTLDVYRRDYAPPSWEPAAGLPNGDGHVFDVQVGLEHGGNEQLALRWTMRDVQAGLVVERFRDVVGERFAAENANGLHRIWVPCPRADALPYVVEFTLTPAQESSTPLASGQSGRAECRQVEG